MNYIAISFTLKDQKFSDILPALQVLSKNTGAQLGTCCLVHGFMPREEVVKKGLSTEVVDALKDLFPIQMNCYIDSPQRDLMVSVIKQNYGTAYIIGDATYGALEEMELYKKSGVSCFHLPLIWEGPLPVKDKTEGEYRVRIDFNVGKSGLVNDLKTSGARFIDLINDFKVEGGSARDQGSICRLKALAMTAVEHATSDAVKAATVIM